MFKCRARNFGTVLILSAYSERFSTLYCSFHLFLPYRAKDDQVLRLLYPTTTGPSDMLGRGSTTPAYSLW